MTGTIKKKFQNHLLIMLIDLMELEIKWHEERRNSGPPANFEFELGFICGLRRAQHVISVSKEVIDETLA